jgi:isopenicillin N synthase-like dioxygenase
MAADTPSFTTIPILDYSLSASPTTKPKFLSGLRNALVNVGFFYLINAPIAPQIQQELVKKCTGIFELPQKKKLEIEMINSKHFLGYSRLGAEITARKQDYREQFDVRLVLSETYIASEYANSLMRSLLRNYQLRDRRNRFIGIFGDLTRYAHAASLLLLLCS